MKNRKKREQNGGVSYVQFIFGSKPISFLRLVTWFPLSHPVCSLPLHQFFLLYRDIKRILKKTISLKKKPNYPFILVALKKWTCLPSVLKRHIALMWLKNLIFYFMDLCFDPFLPCHPNWLPSQGIQCAKPSKYIHTIFVFVYFSVFKHEINS